MNGPAIKNGGQAFPGFNYVSSNVHDGMTLRDYFAAKAMQGICAHADTWGLSDEQIVVQSFKLADAMLRAREGGAQ